MKANNTTMAYDIAEVEDVIREVIKKNARTATLFLSEKRIVRVTRTTFSGKFKQGNLELSITIGKPNYEEREYIAMCKKMKEQIEGVIRFKFLKAKR